MDLDSTSMVNGQTNKTEAVTVLY